MSAEAGQNGAPRTVSASGGSLSITAFTDGLRRDKYVVRGKDTRNVWYAQNGSSNAGRGETGRHTSKSEWCRVRYLYNDNVRIPECWGSFMYSSHLITGLDGTHYELWFSPSSLSYFKIRNQETGIWYAHDGSANDGRLHTTKDDWCRVIYYHMTGIIKRPNECDAFAERVTKSIAGMSGPAAQNAELAYVRNMLGQAPKKTGETIGGAVTEEGFAKLAEGSIKHLDWERGAGPLSKLGSGGVKGAAKSFAAGVGVGIAVDYGVDAIKNKAGWTAKDANAGAIAGEVVTTTVATSAISTAIMTAAGASFNPVVMGVGVLVAGGISAGQEIAKASKDTGIRFENNGMAHPRYNRDLNGISELVFAQKNPPGTFKWEKCADEGKRCEFSGLRSVMYGAGEKWTEAAFIDGAHCTNKAMGRDPAPGKVKSCHVQKLNWDRQSTYFVKQFNNPAIYLQQGEKRHCHVSNMSVMNAYGGTGSVRVASRSALKGSFDGACALPNGFYKASNASTIYYLSGPDTESRSSIDRVVGSRACAVPNMPMLRQMGGDGQFMTMDAGTDILRHRRNMGVCNVGLWAEFAGVKLRDIGDGWAISNTPGVNDFQIVKWGEAAGRWTVQPGAASRIGGTYHKPWVMTQGGTVFEWTGKTWTHAPGKNATDVGDGWIISNETTPGGKKIYRWNFKTKTWVNIPGGAVRIGGTYSSPWIVNDGGAVFEYVDNKWVHHSGLSADDVGDGWALAKTATLDSEIYRWNKGAKRWDVVHGGAMQNIGGNADYPMIQASNGAAYYWR
jgi:hypothetical protein